MNLKRLLILIGKSRFLILAFFVGVLAAALLFKINFMTAAVPNSTDQIQFEIAKGSSPKEIFDQLVEKGIAKNSYSLSFFSKFKKNDSGQINILAGEYAISPGLKPKEIIALLVSGKTVQHPITIKEGYNLTDVTKAIAESKLLTFEDIEKAMNNPQIFAKLGIIATTPEGYFVPETYHFSRPVTAEEIITRIVEEGQKRIASTLKGWEERAATIGFKPYQVLVLASIIEKETGSAEERRLISSVFHNRLRLDMPLQSDPTVIYGIANFNGNLTKENLKTPGPYNTYLNQGLPVTPICNPGIESIKAALFPEDTDYLYFVAKGDGTHQFSATYKEHQRAVEQYQKSASAQVSRTPN